jgi:hypothetical protein
VALAALACAPRSPCRTRDFHKILEWSRPFAGAWTVARGDTLTLPQMGDRFKLRGFTLDTDTVVVGGGRECHFRGRLIFSAPRAETLAVSWYGVPERATIYGWPVDVGPFAGLWVSWWGRDSLRGTLLFDETLGVQVRPGVTAQFVAGRRR